MKSKPRRTGRACLLLAALAGAVAGCQRSSLELISYQDPYFPERYVLSLTTCAYRLGPSGDIHVAGRSERQTDVGTTTQHLHVHVYWKPWPGKTSADPTTTTAVLTYVVANEQGALVYRGTGFAYPRRSAGRLRVDLESARLHLESRSGDIADLLGDARVRGTLYPADQATRAADLIRELELRAAR